MHLCVRVNAGKHQNDRGHFCGVELTYNILHGLVHICFEKPEDARVKLLFAYCRFRVDPGCEAFSSDYIRKVSACLEHQRTRDAEMSEHHLSET